MLYNVVHSNADSGIKCGRLAGSGVDQFLRHDKHLMAKKGNRQDWMQADSKNGSHDARIFFE
jgi:hypothetical protein